MPANSECYGVVAVCASQSLIPVDDTYVFVLVDSPFDYCSNQLEVRARFQPGTRIMHSWHSLHRVSA